MKINKDSWHYKLWAKTFDRHEIPEETDLCRYCHKVFWQCFAIACFVSMIIVAVVMALALLVMLGRAFWLHTGVALQVTVAIAAAITVLVLYVRWLTRSRYSRPEPKTLVGQYARATKQRVCPLVEFTDDES